MHMCDLDVNLTRSFFLQNMLTSMVRYVTYDCDFITKIVVSIFSLDTGSKLRKIVV
jgi:hypothetical protein